MRTLNLWFVVLFIVFVLSVATAYISKVYEDKRMRNVSVIMMFVSLAAIIVSLFL